jgi:hypothetical protein
MKRAAAGTMLFLGLSSPALAVSAVYAQAGASASTVGFGLVAARVVETAIRIAFASACPDAAIFKAAAINLHTAGP